MQDRSIFVGRKLFDRPEIASDASVEEKAKALKDLIEDP